MVVYDIKDKCSGCSACANICKVNAIAMKENEEGFLYPDVDDEKCINCGQCESVCQTYTNCNTNIAKAVIGCYSKNEDIQKASCSGGFFYELAKLVIEEGGIAVGAAYEGTNVKHIIVREMGDLERLQGSKYIQSEMGDIFREIKKELDLNIVVLFSGTGCQIDGLKRYLGKEYSKLITVDLICHGVPSQKVLNTYLSEMNNGSAQKVEFRNKDNLSGSINIYTYNDESIMKKYIEDVYIKGFVKNLYLRPSCYECNYKGDNRNSDFTIGDYWAVNEYHKDFSNGRGTSLVFIRTIKAEQLWKKIEEKFMVVNTDVKRGTCWNENYHISAKKSQYRELFWKMFEQEGFVKTTDFILDKIKLEDEEKTIKEKKTILKKIIKFKNKF